jgi:hypothetical protein
MGGFSSLIDQLQTQIPDNGRQNTQSTGTITPLPSSVQTIAAPPKPLDGIQEGYFSQTPNQPRPMGKGGVQTNSATSGQPRMGQQNQYSNTVGQWDNTQQQTQQPMQGKGKGA